MNYYERALELKDETIANRRHIHKNAETGLDLPKTKAYVILQHRSCAGFWLKDTVIQGQ